MTKEQFLQYLKAYRTYLPRHTLLTLRGQALAGDVDGAARGLTQFLKKTRMCAASRLTFMGFRALMSSR